MPPDWVLAIILVSGVVFGFLFVFPLWPVDLFHIQYAAYQWHTGDPDRIYITLEGFPMWVVHFDSVAVAHGITRPTRNMHYYPPFLSALLSPFSDVHIAWWRDTVFVLDVLMLFVLAYETLLLCRVEITRRAFLWALALPLVCYPMMVALRVVQIGPMLVALLWAALLAYRRGNETRAGALIGAVGLVKIFPLGILLFPALQRKWKTVLVAAAVFCGVILVSLLVLGTSIHRDWLDSLRDISGTIWPYYENQSISGWFSRAVMGHWLYDDPFVATPLANAAKWVSILVFGGITLSVLWRTRNTATDEDFAPRVGLLLSGMILCMAIAWDHYWLLVLPVVGWAIREAWERRTSRADSTLLALAAFLCLAPLYMLYGSTPSGRIISGTQTVGMILFWIWLVRRMNLRLPTVEPQTT